MTNISRRALLAGTSKIVAACGLPALGAPEPDSWLDRVAEQLRTELKIPAIWLAAGFGGKIETAVAGVRKHDDPTPAELNDKLMIASISKPFAGTWIATMVAKGAVRYDGRLLDVMPELADACLPEHRDITLAQLLTHTAGVKRDAYPQADFSRTEVLPAYRLAIARELLSTPAPNPPGKELYSNAGLTTAAALVERVVHGNYNVSALDYFQTRLGLKSWGMGSPNLKGDLTAPWHHHIMADGKVTAQPTKDDHVLVAFPSGGVHCTIGDLARFGQITMDSWRGRSPELSKIPMQELLAKRPDSNTTLCAWARSDYDVPAFTHAGGLVGLNSLLEILPDLDIVFAYVVTAAWWRDGKLSEKQPDISSRVRELVRDELRRVRMRRIGQPRCAMALTNVVTVDATRKQIVRPARNDDKVRVNVEFTVSGEQTGDLNVVMRLADQKREANFFRGLAPGNHMLYFDFDIPKSGAAKAELVLDAIGTGGNTTPEVARFRGELSLDGF